MGNRQFIGKSRLGAASLAGLANWFERQKRVLPWRDQPTLYRVWISEVMLQQTQVVTVVPYFERFLARFPDVESLARATLDEVLLHWAGLGYYSRARNIHRTAQLVVRQGDFPRTREAWLEMPGVGPYTAGAILSIALDQPEAILDGNVERVLSRVGRVGEKAELWEFSRLAVEDGARRGIRPSVLNQALMELGAMVCSPKKPRCELCPLKRVCAAQGAGDAEEFPPKKKRTAWIKVREELHCIVDRSGRLLLRRREKGEWREGLWDLPDQKPEGPKPGKIRIGTVESRHVVTRHKIDRTTHVWKLNDEGETFLKKNGPGGMRWVPAKGAGEVAMGSALKRTLQMIRERYPEVFELRGFKLRAEAGQ